MECLGIRGIALRWFTTYLASRLQCVKVGNNISSPNLISFGVPQGSILGPTLFIIYLNDITTTSGIKADTICYADDTAIIFSAKTKQAVIQAAEYGMTKVTEWLRENLLTVNLVKTKFLWFHKTKASDCPEIRFLPVHTRNCNHTDECVCNSIERADSIKYLGVILDDKLTFKNHAVALANRVRKMIHVMKILRDIADGGILKMVYLTLCQSVINYCILAWGGANSSVLILVERAQRAVLKVALRRPRWYSTISLYNDTQVLSVRKLYVLRSSMFTHKQVIGSLSYKNMLLKRVFKLKCFPVKTTFAKRFKSFLFPFIYNKIVNVCDIAECTLHESKGIVQRYLLEKTYDDVESLLRVIC